MYSLIKRAVLIVTMLMAMTLPISAIAVETNGSEPNSEVITERSVVFLTVGIMITIVLACVAFSLARATSAAIGAVAEKPEMFSSTLIYIMFIEAIAIYVLMMAFMILGMV